MKSILQQILTDSINPEEAIQPWTEAYKKAVDRFCTQKDSLEQKLSQENQKELEKLLEYKSDMHCENITQFCSYGFKFGALLMLEILAEPFSLD